MWFNALWILLTGCSVRPLLAPSQEASTIHVTAKDKYLAYLVSKAFKQYETRFQGKHITIDIDDKEGPLIYNELGEIERWHKKLVAKVTADGKTRNVTVHASFIDQGDYGNVFLATQIKERLAQDLARQCLVSLSQG